MRRDLLIINENHFCFHIFLDRLARIDIQAGSNLNAMLVVGGAKRCRFHTIELTGPASRAALDLVSLVHQNLFRSYMNEKASLSCMLDKNKF